MYATVTFFYDGAEEKNRTSHAGLFRAALYH